MGDFVLPRDLALSRENLVSGHVVLASDGSLIANPESAEHGWKLHDRRSKTQAYRHG